LYGKQKSFSIPTEATVNQSDLRFLVVDDFSTMRRIVRGLLKEMSCHNSEEAEDGEAALAMLKTGKFDFVITDVNMPNMNGFELLEAIKMDSSLRHIPVLMITAETTPEDLRRAYKNGASGYMEKPFTRAMLEERIQRIVEKFS
jgi:two-component system, chemotaxis family, chemotaxis protein CheY